MRADVPDNEQSRLRALRNAHILDTLPEETFNEIVHAVANFLHVPIVLISLVDVHRQWFKAKCGLDASETSRDVAFCAHTILQADPLIVPDATQDLRFQSNPLVKGDFHLRFYAGAPIVVDGQRIGTLCCIDRKPRTLSRKHIDGLVHAANVVSGLIANRSLAEELAASEHRFSRALHSMHEGLVMQDETGAIVEANRRACEILGLTMEQLQGKTSIDPSWRCVDQNGEQWPGETHPAMIALKEGTEQFGKVMGVHKPCGQLTWIMINAVPLKFAPDHDPYAVVCTFSDITTLRAQSQIIETQHLELLETARKLYDKSQRLESTNSDLRDLAMRDALTGLQNHRSFQERLKEISSMVSPESRAVSVLMIDVDDFKRINDEFGHQVGDAVLRQLGVVIATACRNADTAYRYGGEELAIIMPGTEASEASAWAEQVRVAIERADWPVASVTVSIGLATRREGTLGAELVRDADRALYACKRAGKNCVMHAEFIVDRRDHAA